MPEIISKRERQNATKMASYYRNHEENKAKLREQGRKHRYGLLTELFNWIASVQGDKCAICGTSSPGGHGTWHVDHDHACCPGRKSCGKCVRGLLCIRCNVKLDILEDTAWVQKAQDYLEVYKLGDDKPNGDLRELVSRF
jgi:hypothetical protein